MLLRPSLSLKLSKPPPSPISRLMPMEVRWKGNRCKTLFYAPVLPTLVASWVGVRSFTMESALNHADEKARSLRQQERAFLGCSRGRACRYRCRGDAQELRDTSPERKCEIGEPFIDLLRSPCLAMPSRALPRLAEPSLPCPAVPRRAVPRLACRAGARPSSPSPASPAMRWIARSWLAPSCLACDVLDGFDDRENFLQRGVFRPKGFSVAPSVGE